MTQRRSLLSFLLAALALPVVVVGCGDDLCQQTALTACDIRTSSCQTRVLDALTCLRGSKLSVRPSFKLITPAGYEDYLRTTSYVATAETPLWESAYRQLGVLPADLGLVDAQVQQRSDFVGAYFVREENA